MDCGSGYEFVFPHLSASDREGPSKAIDGLSYVKSQIPTTTQDNVIYCWILGDVVLWMSLWGHDRSGVAGLDPTGGPPHHPRPINIKLSWVGVGTRDFIAKVHHRAHESA